MFCLVENRNGRIVGNSSKFLELYDAIMYWIPYTSIRHHDLYSIRWME